MDGLLNVSSNPHIRSKQTTSSIMLMVVISLLPACGYGIYRFGLSALMLLSVSVIGCIFFEYLFTFILRKKPTIGDFSAIVTGLLLGMNLPPSAPWWIALVGAFFAIIVVKMLFGGLGQNFMNPALGARCFLLISFTSIMTNFNTDTMSGATPLARLEAGEKVDIVSLLTGNIQGTIGETSAICLLIGGCLLFLFGVIDLIIPLLYILSFALCIAAFGGYGFNFSYIISHVLGGGLMLGAFFMATDYTTRPISKTGQAVYGVLLGILTAVLRVFGPSAEGVSYAIIIGNLLVPLIDKITRPAYFGKGATKNA